MSLPVRDVVLPAVLAGASNGKLDDTALAPVDGGRLLAVAARAWNAMVAAALADGIDLAAGDTYRDLGTQMSYFMERYTLEELAGRPSRVWLGQRYWQRPSTDEAAVPGTSNHGWGLAVDVRSVTYASRLMWLIYNAARFGFSAEIQNEAWHWHYFGGDNFQLPDTPLFPSAADPDDEDDMTDEQIERLSTLIAQKTAAAIMNYPVSTIDFNAEGHPEISAPLASIEGWRNTEIAMTRRGIGRE